MKSENGKPGEWGFWGRLSPESESAPEQYGPQYEFSVGVFQWAAKAGGKGVKQTSPVYRVKGNWGEPELVRKAATKLCRLLNEGSKDKFPGTIDVRLPKWREWLDV